MVTEQAHITISSTTVVNRFYQVVVLEACNWFSSNVAVSKSPKTSTVVSLSSLANVRVMDCIQSGNGSITFPAANIDSLRSLLMFFSLWRSVNRHLNAFREVITLPDDQITRRTRSSSWLLIRLDAVSFYLSASASIIFAAVSCKSFEISEIVGSFSLLFTVQFLIIFLGRLHF